MHIVKVKSRHTKKGISSVTKYLNYVTLPPPVQIVLPWDS